MNKSKHVPENLHVILWLLKDMLWCMNSTLGILMVCPTVSVSIYILYICRDNKSDLYHNLSIGAWIIANSTWMVGDLLHKEAYIKPYAIFIFSVGVAILGYYYSMMLFKKLYKSYITRSNTVD